MTLLDIINIWLLLVVMAIYGTAQGFWTPIRLSMAPNLVPREDLPSAIGLSAVMFNTAQFIGPALAGVVLAVMGDNRTSIGALFLINSASFLGYYVVLFFIKLRVDEHRKAKDGHLIADLKEGVVYCTRKEGLGLFMIYMLLVNVLLRCYRELLAGLADGVYGAGVHGFAALQSAAGLGAILGSVFLTKFSKVDGLTRLLLNSSLMAVIFQFAMVGTSSYWVGIVSVGFLSGFIGFYGIGSQVLVQSAIHGVMRGRVMSLWAMGTRSGPSVGAWVVGLAAEVWGLRIALAAATAVFVIMQVIMFPRRKRLAQVLETAPEDEMPEQLVKGRRS